MSPTSERAAAFAFAALTPATLTGLFVLCVSLVAPGDAGFGAGYVLVAILVFMVALFVAGLHVFALAVPLYGALSEQGTPGPIAVLLSSFVIGALPLPMLFGAARLEPFALFGLLGLSGGVAFLLVAGPPANDADAS